MAEENIDIHESDTGVIAFDVTPHESKPASSDASETANDAEGQSEGVNAYAEIIAQKDEQINALIEQTKSLTNQITQMVQGGVQIRDGEAGKANTANVSGAEQFNPRALSDDDDYSLEALGREIGKK